MVFLVERDISGERVRFLFKEYKINIWIRVLVLEIKRRMRG